MKNFITLILAAASFLLLCNVASGEDTKMGTDLPFLKGVLVEVKAYDAATKTYEVFSPPFSGEGSSFVTPEGLAKGIKAIDLTRILDKPTSIVGIQFTTDGEIPTLFDEERDARRTPNSVKAEKHRKSKK